MKIQHIAAWLSVINLIIAGCLLSQSNSATGKKQQPVEPVLRARSLEIVDNMGRVRASITI
jgi:hypothetical protein